MGETERLTVEIISELQAKLDKIEQIVNKYDGTIASMITQFGKIQKVLEENN